MMKNSMTRILWFIAGILLILSGCTLLFRPDASLISMAGMIGFVILLSGIFNLTIYFVFHDLMLGAGWQLLDGILGVLDEANYGVVENCYFSNHYSTDDETPLVGFMFLGNSVLVASVLPYIFGMWIMFSGLSKLVGGFDLKKLNFDGWGWLVLIGAAMTVLGLLTFFKPMIGTVALSTIFAIALIVEGAHALLRGIYFQRFWL